MMENSLMFMYLLIFLDREFIFFLIGFFDLVVKMIDLSSIFN